MSRIFISYKRVDKDKVFRIKDQIESALDEKCWIDLDGIESDAVFASKIIGAINQCEVFLFMYSNAHKRITDYENDWTIRELNFAQDKKKRIVFINLDGSELMDWFILLFGTKQQVDANLEDNMSRLIIDLRQWLNSINTDSQDATPIVRKDNETIENAFMLGYTLASSKIGGSLTETSEYLEKLDKLPSEKSLLCNPEHITVLLKEFYSSEMSKTYEWGQACGIAVIAKLFELKGANINEEQMSSMIDPFYSIGYKLAIPQKILNIILEKNISTEQVASLYKVFVNALTHVAETSTKCRFCGALISTDYSNCPSCKTQL